MKSMFCEEGASQTRLCEYTKLKENVEWKKL